jgi:hypothetical protein
MLPKSVAKRTFANTARARDGFLTGTGGSDGGASDVGGGEFQKRCSTPFVDGRPDGRPEGVGSGRKEVGSAGGKRESSSSVSSLARSKFVCTTLLNLQRQRRPIQVGGAGVVPL